MTDTNGDGQVTRADLQPVKKPLMTNAGYDTLKQAVQVGLPAAGTLYAALAVIWGIPWGEEVVGSIAAVTVFGGVWLGIIGRRYNKSEERFDGQVVVDTINPEKDVVTLDTDVTKLLNGDQSELRLKVVREA